MARSSAIGPTGISSRFWRSWALLNNPDSSCLLRATRSADLSPLGDVGAELCLLLHLGLLKPVEDLELDLVPAIDFTPTLNLRLTSPPSGCPRHDRQNPSSARGA